ncbi:MAG: hypothetical protein ACXVLF_16650 [Flavisolibacter sp.]
MIRIFTKTTEVSCSTLFLALISRFSFDALRFQRSATILHKYPEAQYLSTRIKPNNNVIIIDDDRDDREILREVFIDIGTSYEPVFFENGPEVFNYLMSVPWRPFVIISDINMPVISVKELKRKIDSTDYLRKKVDSLCLFNDSRFAEHSRTGLPTHQPPGVF